MTGATPDPDGPVLTEAQREVLELTLTGEICQEIADELGKSLAAMKYFALALSETYGVSRRKDLEAEGEEETGSDGD